MDNAPLTLLNINIERDKHIDNIIKIIGERAPDILCFEEIQRPFADELASRFGYTFQFSLRTFNEDSNAKGEPIEEGTMIAWNARCKLMGVAIQQYNKQFAHFPESGPNNVSRTLLVVTLKCNEQIYRIGLTHFTWTPDGSASDEQREDMRRLLSALAHYHDKEGIVFCGDFNAPRGGEIFAMMNELYKDNLPKDVTTTLDQKLHRASPIVHVVDTIFSTKEYSIHNVEVIEGVSDHKALFAVMSKSVC